MKRVGHLFDAIADRDNLRLAFAKAIRGKRAFPEVHRFARQLDRHLDELGEQLRAGTVRVGHYRQFVIYDPKERVITAPCLRERVLHHAIVNVCEPHLERWLISDTFACRTGKGRIKALLRAREFAGQSAFFLKMDVRKYFDSISHDTVIRLLCQQLEEEPLLTLLERIVRCFRGPLD